MVQLTDDLVESLDREAERRGVSHSTLILEAVTIFLADTREAELTRLIVNGYRRVPAGEPDGWGALERLGEIATVELLQRLDEDESGQGHAPW